MPTALPEPSDQITDSKQLFLVYLDYYRSAIVVRLDGLSEADLRASRLPSGWTPIELLKHLVHMERRWLVWGFAGQDVADPWGDWGPVISDLDPWTSQRDDRRWYVAPDEQLEALVDALHAGGAATRKIVENSRLSDRAAESQRFGDGPPPTLNWILFHVVQEYARHAGHLDVVRELADGMTG